MTEKVNLNADFQIERTYEVSDFQSKLSKMQEKIDKMEEWKTTVNQLIHRSDEKRTDRIKFDEIEEVKLTKKFENIETNELFFLFKVKTDTAKTSVLLEYLGKEPFTEQNVYHLHTPEMNEINFEATKVAVLEQLETEQPIILTHRHTTTEDELSNFIITLTAKEDYIHYDDEDKPLEVILQEGKAYRVTIPNMAKVEYKPNKFHYLPFISVYQYFDLSYDGLEELREKIEEEINILGEFDTFLKEINEENE